MYENLKGKKLLVIGSAEEDSNIVKVAQSMGVYVIAADGKPKSQTTFAKNIADEDWQVDYSDTEKIGKMCKDAGVDGILAGYSEFRVLAASRLAKYLGKPFYATEDQVELTRNKELFKSECKKYGVPVPGDYLISGDEWIGKEYNVKFPVIVKPTDYGGRKGITICYTKEELDKAIPYALEYSQSKTAIVEDYIEGLEYVAIYTMKDGEISLSTFNEKYINDDQERKTGLCDLAVTPSALLPEYIETTDKYVRAFLEGIGAKDGVAMLQGIANDNACYVFEMGYRLNGGNDHYLIESINGISYLRMLISHSLTGSMGDDLSKDNPFFKRYCSTFIKYIHGGVIGRSEFVGDENYPGLDKIQKVAFPGMTFVEDGSTQQRAYSFKLSAASIDELADLINYIQDNLIVEDENGNDLFLPRFNTDKLRK